MEDFEKDVTPEEARLLIAIARLEAKLDVALAQHSASIAQHDEAIEDHEARLRHLEETPTVSPSKLWTTVSAAAGLIVSILMLVLNFMH